MVSKKQYIRLPKLIHWAAMDLASLNTQKVTGAFSSISRYVQGGQEDGMAPSAINDLAAKDISTNTITLSWTAPGDDGNEGTANSYDLRYTTVALIISSANFNNAIQVQDEPAPKIAGSSETFIVTGLNMGTTYYFAIKTKDEAGNISELSNSVAAKTLGLYAIRVSSSTETQIVVVNSYSESMRSFVNIFGSTKPASEIAVNFTISTYPIGSIGYELSKSSEATNAQGLADVQLRLGDIPAEYGVTATCPSCVPSASTVTFTCCGKLPNDNFSQSRVGAWSYDCYARHNCSIEPKTTIGYLGCGVTALATLTNYYANTYPELNISTTTQGALNAYLRGLPIPQGYDRNNDVQFRAIGEYSENIINQIGDESGNIWDNIPRQMLLERADNELLAGRPVIFRVRRLRSDGTFGPHFITVIGKCGNDYIITDPAGGVEGLYNPNDPDLRFKGIRIFRI